MTDFEKDQSHSPFTTDGFGDNTHKADTSSSSPPTSKTQQSGKHTTI